MVGLGSLVWWASVSVSGGCCVVVGGGGGGRGAKPRVGGCALGVGRCVFRGLGQDFAKMVHFRPSENLENNFRQHVVLLEYQVFFQYICEVQYSTVQQLRPEKSIATCAIDYIKPICPGECPYSILIGLGVCV